ncbi:MAG: beta-N-acetylhexosaminidase [Deltaproteobacteria bacterium]|nr:beta-N-acetylhexosaminidase [Deltaproteobacteria bacterium]
MMTLNLKKLIGSLCVFGFEGTETPKHIESFIQDWNLGGVILFKRNIESLEQLAALNQALIKLSDHPLLLGVDHEGGRVFRLPAPFTHFPPLQKIGDCIRKQKNPQLAFQLGQIMARELCAVGFNLNFAPVTDVNSNPQNPIIGDRAFSADAAEVGPWCHEFLQGLASEGIIGCAKHFPGHGDTEQDSHLELPVVNKTEAKLWDCELRPFRDLMSLRAMSSLRRQGPMMGRGNLPFFPLMTAHVKYPALDPDWPATLSSKILTDLLRKKLDYQGVIFSDDFEMKGISAYYPIPEAAEQFLHAGGDAILLCHHEEPQINTLEHLLRLAEKNSQFRDLLSEKQARLSSLSLQTVLANLSQVGCKEHLSFAKSFRLPSAESGAIVRNLVNKN